MLHHYRKINSNTDNKRKKKLTVGSKILNSFSKACFVSSVIKLTHTENILKLFETEVYLNTNVIFTVPHTFTGHFIRNTVLMLTVCTTCVFLDAILVVIWVTRTSALAKMFSSTHTCQSDTNNFYLYALCEHFLQVLTCMLLCIAWVFSTI